LLGINCRIFMGHIPPGIEGEENEEQEKEQKFH
jgi:hypothetical protein